jgi:excinuclease ABC subunit B
MRLQLKTDEELSRERLLYHLVEMHYERNDYDFHRGVFRVRGDRVEIFPAYEDERALRVDFFGDQIEQLSEIDPLRGTTIRRLEQAHLFPASHYVATRTTLKQAVETIKAELKSRINRFRNDNKLIEAQRIEERTSYDLEMMHELGYCTGIENYSRHLTGRETGQPPPTLLDYFPEDYIVFMDESHISVPQVRAMYRGDRSRKTTLVEYGFRLPSALDNRPLTFEEFRDRVRQVVYVSATPADYELEISEGDPVELIVRPTGLVDPEIDIRSAENQVDHLYGEIAATIDKGERVLVTTLTKRMAEDLTDYFGGLGLQVRYLHSDISTLERMEIIRDLRAGEFDVLIGINLLREGLDLPEVSLVAILDADKEGFLRSERSLVQTFGRAARNASGRVILYADKTTSAMRAAIEETRRRQEIQRDYNRKHRITPTTVQKDISTGFESLYAPPDGEPEMISESLGKYGSTEEVEALIIELEEKMNKAAKDLEFEAAAGFRDRINALKKRLMFEG